MLRVIDLDQLTKDQESQTIFTFSQGVERHGIQAAELFDLLRNKLASSNSAKGSSRKAGTQKKSSMSENVEFTDGNGHMSHENTQELGEDATLS